MRALAAQRPSWCQTTVQQLPPLPVLEAEVGDEKRRTCTVTIREPAEESELRCREGDMLTPVKADLMEANNPLPSFHSQNSSTLGSIEKKHYVSGGSMEKKSRYPSLNGSVEKKYPLPNGSMEKEYLSCSGSVEKKFRSTGSVEKKYSTPNGSVEKKYSGSLEKKYSSNGSVEKKYRTNGSIEKKYPSSNGSVEKMGPKGLFHSEHHDPRERSVEKKDVHRAFSNNSSSSSTHVPRYDSQFQSAVRQATATPEYTPAISDCGSSAVNSSLGSIDKDLLQKLAERRLKLKVDIVESTPNLQRMELERRPPTPTSARSAGAPVMSDIWSMGLVAVSPENKKSPANGHNAPYFRGHIQKKISVSSVEESDPSSAEVVTKGGVVSLRLKHLEQSTQEELDLQPSPHPISEDHHPIPHKEHMEPQTHVQSKVQQKSITRVKISPTASETTAPTHNFSSLGSRKVLGHQDVNRFASHSNGINANNGGVTLHDQIKSQVALGRKEQENMYPQGEEEMLENVVVNPAAPDPVSLNHGEENHDHHLSYSRIPQLERVSESGSPLRKSLRQTQEVADIERFLEPHHHLNYDMDDDDQTNHSEISGLTNPTYMDSTTAPSQHDFDSHNPSQGDEVQRWHPSENSSQTEILDPPRMGISSRNRNHVDHADSRGRNSGSSRLRPPPPSPRRPPLRDASPLRSRHWEESPPRHRPPLPTPPQIPASPAPPPPEAAFFAPSMEENPSMDENPSIEDEGRTPQSVQCASLQLATPIVDSKIMDQDDVESASWNDGGGGGWNASPFFNEMKGKNASTGQELEVQKDIFAEPSAWNAAFENNDDGFGNSPSIKVEKDYSLASGFRTSSSTFGTVKTSKTGNSRATEKSLRRIPRSNSRDPIAKESMNVQALRQPPLPSVCTDEPSECQTSKEFSKDNSMEQLPPISQKPLEGKGVKAETTNRPEKTTLEGDMAQSHMLTSLNMFSDMSPMANVSSPRAGVGALDTSYCSTGTSSTMNSSSRFRSRERLAKVRNRRQNASSCSVSASPSLKGSEQPRAASRTCTNSSTVENRCSRVSAKDPPDPPPSHDKAALSRTEGVPSTRSRSRSGAVAAVARRRKSLSRTHTPIRTQETAPLASEEPLSPAEAAPRSRTRSSQVIRRRNAALSSRRDKRGSDTAPPPPPHEEADVDMESETTKAKVRMRAALMSKHRKKVLGNGAAGQNASVGAADAPPRKSSPPPRLHIDTGYANANGPLQRTEIQANLEVDGLISPRHRNRREQRSRKMEQISGIRKHQSQSKQVSSPDDVTPTRPGSQNYNTCLQWD